MGIYKGGWVDWNAKSSISKEELFQLINSNDLYSLIDIRDSNEYKTNCIPTAVNIPCMFICLFNYYYYYYYYLILIIT